MLAMADPLDEGLIDEVRFTAGLDINAVTADVAAIRKKIDELYGNGEVDFKELETLVSAVDPYEGIEIVIEDDDATKLEDLLRDTDSPPAIRLANAIILEAIRLGASDIHIQPRTKSVNRALPHRRGALGQDQYPAPSASIAGVAPENHVGARYFRAPSAAGRADHGQDPDAHGRPAHFHLADHQR